MCLDFHSQAKDAILYLNSVEFKQGNIIILHTHNQLFWLTYFCILTAN